MSAGLENYKQRLQKQKEVNIRFQGPYVIIKGASSVVPKCKCPKLSKIEDILTISGLWMHCGKNCVFIAVSPLIYTSICASCTFGTGL